MNYEVGFTLTYVFSKVEKSLKGSQDLIPSPSVKIQIMRESLLEDDGMDPVYLLKSVLL